MKRRIALPLFAAAVLLLAALSVGSAVLLAAGALILLLLLWGSVSVRWTARTLRMETLLDGNVIQRGEQAGLRLRVTHRCPLPTAPLTLTLDAGPWMPPEELEVPPGQLPAELSLPITALHVGVSRPGILACEVRDVFGFFARRVAAGAERTVLTTVPRTFSLSMLAFAPCEQAMGTMARAAEDASSPMDVRAWQQGDSMKKVHWKLSARRRELLVRRYEEPTLPEALVLLDCAPPPDARAADWHDALLETAASVMQTQEAAENEVLLPLGGRHPIELSLRMGMPVILRRLAETDFSDSQDFTRALQDALRRVRQIGAAVVITPNLDAERCELMLSLKRMGPTLRVYLVTEDPSRADWQDWIAHLTEGGAEVAFISPPNSNPQ